MHTSKPYMITLGRLSLYGTLEQPPVILWDGDISYWATKTSESSDKLAQAYYMASTQPGLLAFYKGIYFHHSISVNETGKIVQIMVTIDDCADRVPLCILCW